MLECMLCVYVCVVRAYFYAVYLMSECLMYFSSLVFKRADV